MPIPKTYNGINLEFFDIYDSITDSWSEEKLFHLGVYGLNTHVIEWNALFVRKPHPHDVRDQQNSFLASLHFSHQANV